MTSCLLSIQQWTTYQNMHTVMHCHGFINILYTNSGCLSPRSTPCSPVSLITATKTIKYFQHVVRGVECEVWISKRPYPTEDSSIQAYWEWYFTSVCIHKTAPYFYSVS